jgi:EAL domain-containing protein (putative c-di-GMP-specific phosphodiesterase class I)
LRNDIELHLQSVIEAGALFLRYLPEVDMRTGKVLATEALVRWNHPTRGLLPPDDFLPVAEDSGLIVAIDSLVMRRAATDALGWVRPVFVSVNVSTRTVLGGDLVAALEDVLVDLPADRLTIELSERGLLVDDAALQSTLAAVRDLGVRIVVDDFGTGFSSLGYLQRFPVNGVKIDRSFVDRLGARGSDAALVAAVIGMADALGLDTIGEGVETVAQRDALADLGCRLAQGFLFSPPVTSKALQELLDVTAVG